MKYLRYRKGSARRALLTLPALLMMLLMGTVSCSDNIAGDGLEPKVDGTVEIKIVDENCAGYDPSTHILQMGSASLMTTVPVESNTRWSAEVTDCEGQWCSLTFPSGTPVVKDGEFIVQTAANSKGSDGQTKERRCKVTIYALDRNMNRVPDTGFEFTVVQGAQYIGISPSAFEEALPAAGYIQEFSITANLPWVATINEPGFMSVALPDDPSPNVTLEGGRIVFTPSGQAEEVGRFKVILDRNLTRGTRRGVVTISSPKDEFTANRIEMTQVGAVDAFGVSPTITQTFTPAGGSFDLNIYSPDNGWTVSLRESSATEWCRLGADSGNPSGETQIVKVTIDENRSVSAREATVIVAKSNDPTDFREVRVVQMGVDQQLGVTPLGVTSLSNLSPEATMINFSVISLGGDCKISSDSQWLVPGVDAVGGNSRTEVTVSIAENPTFEMRSAELTFTSGSETRRFVITQLGRLPDQPANVPSFSTPWLGGEWTAQSIEFHTVVHFPFGLPEGGVKAGVILWEGDSDEKGATDYACELTPVGESGTTFEIIDRLTGLRGSTTYSAYAYISTSDSTYRAEKRIIFRTPGIYPGEDDNNPPIIVER